MTPRAAIFGCSGSTLTPEERGFFGRIQPLGFILFQRNCESPEQVRELTGDLRALVGRQDAPVLIDQEGGRVARMKPPQWRAAPAAARFGACAQRDVAAAERAVWINHRLLADELLTSGVTVDCAPVLDLPVPGAHDVIGDRAFCGMPDLTAQLGRAACAGLLDGGVLPVIKHIPGHGRAGVDSHLELPRVDTPRAELQAADFAPFASLADAPWAMTAHVVYEAIDSERPATTSPIVVQDIVRGTIGFDGLLLTDDLSMKALKGSFQSRAEDALSAGCDVILHCNGSLAEMQEIAEATPALTSEGLRRWKAGQAQLRGPTEIDRSALLQELDALLDGG